MTDIEQVHEALEEMARQKLLEELSDDEIENADVEGGYDALVIKAREALAALDRMEAAAVPDWQLVPKEPTQEMLAAAFKQAEANLLADINNSHCKSNEERSAYAIRPLYRAMLTAAPPPPAAEKRNPDSEYQAKRGEELASAWGYPAPPPPAAEEEKPMKPHSYCPSVMHMGDCAICGNLVDHPNHISPAAEEEKP